MAYVNYLIHQSMASRRRECLYPESSPCLIPVGLKPI
jgi:hypothetical protein